MSLVLVTSCGKDDKDEPDTPNGGGVTTVDEMIKTATRVSYAATVKVISDAGYVNQLKDLVTNGKTYKKVVYEEEMPYEQYIELAKRKHHVVFGTGPELEHKNVLMFSITEDGKQATVETKDKKIFFELQGSLDIAKIMELINEAPAD